MPSAQAVKAFIDAKPEGFDRIVSDPQKRLEQKRTFIVLRLLIQGITDRISEDDMDRVETSLQDIHRFIPELHEDTKSVCRDDFSSRGEFLCAMLREIRKGMTRDELSEHNFSRLDDQFATLCNRRTEVSRLPPSSEERRRRRREVVIRDLHAFS